MGGKLKFKRSYKSNSFIESAFELMKSIPVVVFEGENAYKDKSWKELVSYFEDSNTLLAMTKDEKEQLYNAVKDKLLKDEYGMEGFAVRVMPYMHDGTNGATSEQSGQIYVCDIMEEDLMDDRLLPDLTTNKRFYGINTLNTIIHETRHAMQMTKVKKWINGENEELDFPEIALLMNYILEDIKKNPINTRVKNEDLRYTQYLMSAYEFDARRCANKKILSFMAKGYFKDVALIDDYLNYIESEELSDLSQGRENANIPKSIKFEIGLTQSYLKYFQNNFNCEMFADLKDLLENFNTLEYYETLIKEYQRLQTRLEENACKFVDKCYKTPELKRYAKIMEKTQKEGKYPLFNMCKTYIELKQENGVKLMPEQTEEGKTEEFASGKVHEFFKKIASYLGDDSQAFEENCITEQEIYDHYEGMLDERFDKVWGEESEEDFDVVYPFTPVKNLPEREKE